jgi:type II secretory pathway component PulF
MKPVLYSIDPVLLFGGIGLLVMALWASPASYGRRMLRWRPLRWLGDSLRWHLPLVHWFERTSALVQVVELLRMSLCGGCPVNDAIRGALNLDVNLHFRRRLACWLQRVERGEEIAGSARACALGAPLAWAFDSGLNAANTPAILEMLASHYRAVYNYRLNLTRYILWPLGIVLLGAIVGFVVYAAFAPTAAILKHLALNLYP